eukprot:GHVT01087324.1.p4 GENE.GHVT01087324.1~~GHVT01087324.1.p4  ORF type:complete len:114 (+),score=12.54 GHVT01087324.1:189-530(+)
MSSVRSAARRRDGGRDTNENGATHYDQSSRGERRGSLSAPIVPRKSRRNARDESDEKTTWVRYLTIAAVALMVCGGLLQVLLQTGGIHTGISYWYSPRGMQDAVPTLHQVSVL